MGHNPFIAVAGKAGGPSFLLDVTGIASVSQGVLNSWGHFLVDSFSPPPSLLVQFLLSDHEVTIRH